MIEDARKKLIKIMNELAGVFAFELVSTLEAAQQTGEASNETD